MSVKRRRAKKQPYRRDVAAAWIKGWQEPVIYRRIDRPRRWLVRVWADGSEGGFRMSWKSRRAMVTDLHDEVLRKVLEAEAEVGDVIDSGFEIYVLSKRSK